MKSIIHISNNRPELWLWSVPYLQRSLETSFCLEIQFTWTLFLFFFLFIDQEIAAIRQAYKKSKPSLYNIGVSVLPAILLKQLNIWTLLPYTALRFHLVFVSEYRKELEQVIKDDTSGDFETLLVELCKVGLFKTSWPWYASRKLNARTSERTNQNNFLKCCCFIPASFLLFYILFFIRCY